MRVLLAASLVSTVLGSIHAFSVFIRPLEVEFSSSRSAVSLTYSLALVALTLTVLLGPRFYGRWSPAVFMLTVCLIAAIGALLAGVADSLPSVWLGYSLVFGAANGLGYGFGLQIAAQSNPGREGFAMGTVTAAYAFGSVFSPAFFGIAVEMSGFPAAMTGLSVALLAAGALSAALLRTVDFRYTESARRASSGPAPFRDEIFLWLGYFGGVMAGLMVIGHAAGISAAFDPGMAIWSAPAIIAACNLAGSIIGGRLADRISLRLVLCSLALTTSVALAGIALFGANRGLIVGLGLVGFAYGGTIAAYPATISKLFGMQQSARVYGRVFTAWGCAGLLGPWLAGTLFDWTGDYRPALYLAAVFGLFSVVAISILFQRRDQTVG